MTSHPGRDIVAASAGGLMALRVFLDDAARGCATVERPGGLVLVQDPAEAAYPGMPASILAATRYAVVLPVGDLAAHVTRLVTGARVPRLG